MYSRLALVQDREAKKLKTLILTIILCILGILLTYKKKGFEWWGKHKTLFAVITLVLACIVLNIILRIVNLI